jgi:DnaJ-class molecular chaperone
MDEDYYKILGVARDASQADIQKAYRNLARKHHPDVSQEPGAKERFQQVQRAFDVLNDPAKREQYDRYGAAFEHMGAGAAPGGRGGAYTWTTGPGGGVEDIDFSQFFGERFGGGGGGFEDIFAQFRRADEAGARQSRSRQRHGEDIRHDVEIPFTTAISGGQVEVTLRRATGVVETLTVKIPPGIDDGQEMRLRGQGEKPAAGTPGDLYLIIRVAPHAWYQRRGNHLYVRTPVTLSEAAAGAKIDVPAPAGTVTVRVPAGSNSGTRLRVKGQGIKPAKGEPGDLYVELQVMLPPDLDESDREQLRALDERHSYDPRRELRWS